MKAFLVGTVLSCRQFTPENTFPSLPSPKVKLNWPKIEKCFGHDVTTPIKESIGAFIIGTGANCASICEFRANDECTSCYHYCEECLEESMLKISDGNINSVHHAFCAIDTKFCDIFEGNAKKFVRKTSHCVSKGFSAGKVRQVRKLTESHTSRSRNINPLANFAPMVNDFVAIRPIVSQEGPRKREKVVTTATTTVATTTVPGTIPSADFKLHTCLGIDRVSLLRFVHNNLWFIETVNSCAVCLEPKRALACARCWKGRFAEPNNAYALFCSLPNTDCSRMRETRFIGMLKRCLTSFGQLKDVRVE